MLSAAVLKFPAPASPRNSWATIEACYLPAAAAPQNPNGIPATNGTIYVTWSTQPVRTTQGKERRSSGGSSGDSDG